MASTTFSPTQHGIHALLILSLMGILACHSPAATSPLIWENDSLRIEASPDLPVVLSYKRKSTGAILQGDSASSGWTVNRHFYPWKEWKITREEEAGACTWALSLPALNVSFHYTLRLQKDGLQITLDHISDPASQLQSISWGESALLNATDDSLHWYALQSALSPEHPFEAKKTKNRGLWTYDENRGRGTDTISSHSCIDACLWVPDRIVVGLHSNTGLFPVALKNQGSKTISLGLNTWFHRLQNQVMPDLSAELLLGGDLNGDARISEHDYFRWKNSHLADVPEWLRGAISYKVFNDAPTLKQPNTTLQELDKIVTALHNLTDGLPQIVYLTGWQYRGHDTGYPSFDQWNERLGPHEGVYQRSTYYREQLNTILSYHINIDDAYPANKGFDPALMADDFDGRPMFWESFHSDSAFHLSHYKDVQSGSLYKRLEDLMKTVPVRKILHIDAMRAINCNPLWEKDSAGVNEELTLGLQPLMQWLKKKDVIVTTEGQNGNPLEMESIVAGFWHIDDPTEAGLLINHRKLIGGGWGEGRGRLECGLGTSLQHDLAYNDFDNSLSFKKEAKTIKEQIFLGSLLYIYYQQRQLLDATKTSDHWTLIFDDSTRTSIDTRQNHLLVTKGDLTIARDDDRFIPLDSAIYVFSKEGGPKQWTLPTTFRNHPLEIFALSEKGRQTAPPWKISSNSIELTMTPDVPVKITLRK